MYFGFLSLVGLSTNNPTHYRYRLLININCVKSSITFRNPCFDHFADCLTVDNWLVSIVIYFRILVTYPRLAVSSPLDRIFVDSNPDHKVLSNHNCFCYCNILLDYSSLNSWSFNYIFIPVLLVKNYCLQDFSI